MLSTVILVDGSIHFCSHPLIVHFMKGVFNLRPLNARYTGFWDVNIVLNYLLSLSPAKDISTKQLTPIFCMLMALISAQRAQTY